MSSSAYHALDDDSTFKSLTLSKTMLLSMVSSQFLEKLNINI